VEKHNHVSNDDNNKNGGGTSIRPHIKLLHRPIWRAINCL